MDKGKVESRARIFNLMLAELIKKRRKESSYSQEYVATKLGMAQSTLSRIEKGKLELSLIQWMQIKDLLGLVIDDLRFDKFR